MAAELTDERLVACAMAAHPDAKALAPQHIEEFLPTWRKFAEALLATQGAEPVAYIDPLANEAVTASRRATWPARNQVRFWKPAFDTAPPPTAELEKKAARYDWLIDCKHMPWGEALPGLHAGIGIDAAIDAAIQSDQAQAGKTPTNPNRTP